LRIIGKVEYFFKKINPKVGGNFVNKSEKWINIKGLYKRINISFSKFKI